MLSIKTNELKTRKHVEIDGHGYYVRRLGNIEQIDLNGHIRRLHAISQIQDEAEKTGTQADPSLDREVEKITQQVNEIFTGLFNDGGDQSKSRQLVRSLTDEDLTELLTRIFQDAGAAEAK